MDKKQSYHISIKNLESKRTEFFLLSEGEDGGSQIVGSDNLAPQFRYGQREYGDFTNHSVWSQSDWSEGGGSRFFQPFRDGYNVYPYSKQYYQKRGLRTLEYPGEIHLGANANRVDNFPEESGEVADTLRIDGDLFFAVNVEGGCKIFKTSNRGQTWSLLFNSVTDLKKQYGVDLSSYNKVTKISQSKPDAIDKQYGERKNPENYTYEGIPPMGTIPLSTFDIWWGERRITEGVDYFVASLRSDDNNNSILVKIPAKQNNQGTCHVYGYLNEDRDNYYQVTSVVSDGDFEMNVQKVEDIFYSAPPVQGGSPTENKTYKRMFCAGGSSDIENHFFIGQMIDLYNYAGTTKLAERRIVAIQPTQGAIILEEDFNPDGEIWYKAKPSPKTQVLRVNKTITELESGKDWQGNPTAMHPFGLGLKNKRTNNVLMCDYSCSSSGASHSRIFNRVYDENPSEYSHNFVGWTVRDIPRHYYIYIPGFWQSIPGDPPSQTWIAPVRDYHEVSEDYRNYFVVEKDGLDSDFATGDHIKFNDVIKIAEAPGHPMVGEFRRKNTELRNEDLFFVNHQQFNRMNHPQDLVFNYNDLDYNFWFNSFGIPNTFYNHFTGRDLFVGSQNEFMIQSYVTMVDEETAGTASTLLDLGEMEISGFYKHNEILYIPTNDKGRVYTWDGSIYKVIQRFPLNPETNSIDISAVGMFWNKIIFVNNFDGNIMGYEPETEIWDDICAPEYEKTKDDVITHIEVLGASLFFTSNRPGNILWEFREDQLSEEGWLISSWYSADIPAVDKRALYVQLLTQKMKRSGAKIRVAVQYDFDDKWYYLAKERGQVMTDTYNSLHEIGFDDYKSSRAAYLFFPYNFPKFKTLRYRIEMKRGVHINSKGGKEFYRPILNNIDLFYIIADPKELVFPLAINLNDRQQLLGGYGNNEIGKHRDKLAFLLDIWNNNTMVELTYVDGEKYTCIPFKPENQAGGGLSVGYSNLGPSRNDLDKLSYFVSLSLKSINKIDNFGK